MNQDYANCNCKYASWHGIFAGALVALGLTFLFNLLTVGLGMSLYTVDEQGQEAIKFGGLAWMFVGSYILLFIAGWSSCKYVCNGCCSRPCSGIKRGFLVWVVYLILSLVLVSMFVESTMLAFLKDAFANMTMGQGGSTTTIITMPNAAPEEAVQKVGLATLSTFLLFLIGAIGSCFGAYCSLKCKKKCQEKCQQDPSKKMM